MNDDVIGFAAMMLFLLAILYAVYITMKHVLSDSKTYKEKVSNRKIGESVKEIILNIIEDISTIVMITGVIMSIVFITLVDNNIGGKLSENILTVSNIGMYVGITLVGIIRVSAVFSAVFRVYQRVPVEDGRLYEQHIQKEVYLSVLFYLLLSIFFTSLMVYVVGAYSLYFQGMSGEVVFYALFAGIVSMISAQLLRNKGATVFFYIN